MGWPNNYVQGVYNSNNEIVGVEDGAGGQIDFLPAYLVQNGLPMIKPSSGSIGNNGALTLTTPLPAGITKSYQYFPAGAIFAGSTAGLYYTVMSSTTVGIIYNNTYTSGQPVEPITPTAFVTTGPGAYTQTTTTIDLITAVLPANSLGKNGSLRAKAYWEFTNSANNKRLAIDFGGTDIVGFSFTTKAVANWDTTLWAQNSTNQQRIFAYTSSPVSQPGIAGDASATTSPSVDTTQDVQVKMQITASNVAEYIILFYSSIEYSPGE